MTIRQLEIFVAIVETGRFTTAAQKLYVAQPSVSQQIQSLEQELGEKLFVRLKNRHVHLTEAGAILKEHADQILRQIQIAKMEISMFSKEPSGRIRLGVAGHQLTSIIPPAISAFHGKFPRICVDIVNGTTPQLMDALRSSRLDVGVVNLRGQTQGLRIQLLFTEELVVVVPATHSLADRKTIDAVTLGSLPLVLYDQSTSTRPLIDSFFRRASVKPNVVLELSSVESMKRMVEAGLGAAIMPDSALLSSGDGQSLHRLRIRGQPLMRKLGIATADIRRMPKVIEELVTLIKARFSAISQMLQEADRAGA